MLIKSLTRWIQIHLLAPRRKILGCVRRKDPHYGVGRRLGWSIAVSIGHIDEYVRSHAVRLDVVERRNERRAAATRDLPAVVLRQRAFGCERLDLPDRRIALDDRDFVVAETAEKRRQLREELRQVADAAFFPLVADFASFFDAAVTFFVICAPCLWIDNRCLRTSRKSPTVANCQRPIL